MNRSRSLASCCLAGLLLLGAVFAAVGPVAGTPAAAAQDEEGFPRAEAGLDQTVQQNASVLLDATESWSPNGEIVDYEWEITSPNGSTIDPQCDSVNCGRGRFRVPELGEYTVTVTVEDVDGRRESDTMYVTVVPRGDFGVELTGPTDALGTNANLTATVSPGNTRVQNLTWYRGGRELTNHSVPVTGGVFNRSTLIVPGETYRAVVTDQFGQTRETNWTAPRVNETWRPDSWEPSGSVWIDGPKIVMGSHDRVGRKGSWQFDGVDYQIESGPAADVTDVTWALDNNNSDDWSNRGTETSLTVDHGFNVVVANVDMNIRELGKKKAAGNDSAGVVEHVNRSAHGESVLRRLVLYDPEPELERTSYFGGDSTVSVGFRYDDPRDPPEEARLTIGGETIGNTTELIDDDDNHVQGTIPDSVEGDTTVLLEIEDGRGQETRDRTVIHVPAEDDQTEDSQGEATDESQQVTTGPKSMQDEPLSVRIDENTDEDEEKTWASPPTGSAIL